eukprot:jgi/Galph1/1115/GphlegSOOS_G5752.1
MSSCTRLQLLQQAFDKAAGCFLETGCCYSNFMECFQPVASVYKEDFGLMYEQFKQLLAIRLQQEFQLLLKEYDMESKMKVCDEIFSRYHVDRSGFVRIPFNEASPSELVERLALKEKLLIREKLQQQKISLEEEIVALEKQLLEKRNEAAMSKENTQQAVKISQKVVDAAINNFKCI